MRKITKIRRSIRAVSPVISVLLMIAIAVIASLIAYAWVMGYIGGRTDQAGKQIQVQSYKAGTNLIYVQNTGQGTVHLSRTSSVYVNDVLKNIDLVDDKPVGDVADSKGHFPINPGQTRKLQINYFIQPGDKIKIVTVEGTWMEVPGANQPSSQNNQQNQVQYTITPSAGAGGSISPSTAQTVNAGSSVTFTIAASQGYHIRDVLVDGLSQGARTSYTFTNVQASHTIHATFEADGAQTQYTITPSAGSGGSITPSTPQTVNAGGSVTFNIAANEGFHIKSVLVDGVSVGAVSSYQFTNVQANHVISADFEPNPPPQYTITPSAGSGGSITPSTPQTVTAGGSVTFTISASQGYQIDDVLVDGSSVGAVPSYAFTNVQASHTIHATFKQNPVNPTQYTITPSAGSGGSITPSTPQTVTAGGSVTFNIAANQGYHIDDVLVDGSSVGAVSSYQFTNVQASHTIHATFAANPPQQFTVTFKQSGLDSSAGTATVVTVNGVPKTFADLQGDGYSITVNVGSSVTYTYESTIPGGDGKQFVSTGVTGPASPVTSAATVTINYKTQYQVAFGQSGVGTDFAGTVMTINGTNYGRAGFPATWVDAGDKFDFSYATPLVVAENVKQYVRTGVNATSPLTITEPTTVIGNYQTQYYLTVTSAQGTVGGQGWYNSGTTAYATLNTGTVSGGTGVQYVFTNWATDASGTNYAQSNGITMNGPKTASANWKTQYYLTVTSAHGTPSGQGWYDSGATAYASLDSGTVSGGTGVQYVFTSWGTDASGTNYAQSSGITMNGPKTAFANWKTQYYITFSVTGSGTTNATGWYDQGDNRVVATANSGYSFSSWTFNGAIQITPSTASPATATINGPGTITANFIQSTGNKLVFIDGTSQTLVVYEPSGRIRIQRQNSAGTPITSGTTYVYLATSSSGGKFYSNAACTNQITLWIAISYPNSYIDVYYRDSNTGTPTITATATNYRSVSTTFTINPATPEVKLTTGFDGTPWDSEWRSWPNPPWNYNTEQYYSSPNSASSVSSNQGAFSSNKVDATGAAYITVSFYFRITGTNPTNFQIRWGATQTDDYNSITWNNLGVNLGDRNVYAANTWHYFSINITDTSAFTSYFRFQFLSQSLPSNAQVWVDNVQIVVNK